MPKLENWTTMGGCDGHFSTTCWTIITDAQISDETRNRLIINELLSRYWKPVYCYLRRKGQDNESAKDLTQGFFQEIVLGRKLIKQADRSKGKFRTFLLTALDRYVIDLHRYKSRKKRKYDGDTFPFDDLDLPGESLAILDMTPEEEFHRVWISQFLDKVLYDVQDECQKTGKEKHWLVFKDRVLNPILDNTNPPSLSELCRKYEIKDQDTTSNMITTIKRRFRKYLYQHLKVNAQMDSEAQEEISHMLKFLNRKGAG